MKNLRFLSWCLCAGLMLMLGACGGDNEPGDSTTESSGSNNANANDASANSVLARMEMPNMKKARTALDGLPDEERVAHCRSHGTKMGLASSR